MPGLQDTRRGILQTQINRCTSNVTPPPCFRRGDDELVIYFTVANSVLVSWPPRKTSKPAASGNSDSTSNPIDVLPVASLIHPIRNGPPKPARLPSELISTIAPAAPVPDSHPVGKVQNTPKVQTPPVAPPVSITIVRDC